jgi:hypothetical protein
VVGNGISREKIRSLVECFFHAKAAGVNAAFPGDLPLMKPPGTDSQNGKDVYRYKLFKLRNVRCSLRAGNIMPGACYARPQRSLHACVDPSLRNVRC